jgi:ankyrin repeat protein
MAVAKMCTDSPFSDDQLALIFSVLAGENQAFEMFQCLLKHGADPNRQDRFGMTSLHYIAENDKFESVSKKVTIVRLLIKHGADVTIRNDGSDTAFDLARRCEGKRASDSILSLLEC